MRINWILCTLKFITICFFLVTIASCSDSPPLLHTVPATSFSCVGRPGGYYGDVEAGCQVYHMCGIHSIKYSYLCPNFTLFQQKHMICDHWNLVECHSTPDFYDLNLKIGKVPKRKEIETNLIPQDERKASVVTSKPFERVKPSSRLFPQTKIQSFRPVVRKKVDTKKPIRKFSQQKKTSKSPRKRIGSITSNKFQPLRPTVRSNKVEPKRISRPIVNRNKIQTKKPTTRNKVEPKHTSRPAIIRNKVEPKRTSLPAITRNKVETKRTSRPVIKRKQIEPKRTSRPQLFTSVKIENEKQKLLPTPRKKSEPRRPLSQPVITFKTVSSTPPTPTSKRNQFQPRNPSTSISTLSQIGKKNHPSRFVTLKNRKPSIPRKSEPKRPISPTQTGLTRLGKRPLIQRPPTKVAPISSSKNSKKNTKLERQQKVPSSVPKTRRSKVTPREGRKKLPIGGRKSSGGVFRFRSDDSKSNTSSIENSNNLSGSPHDVFIFDEEGFTIPPIILSSTTSKSSPIEEEEEEENELSLTPEVPEGFHHLTAFLIPPLIPTGENEFTASIPADLLTPPPESPIIINGQKQEIRTPLVLKKRRRPFFRTPSSLHSLSGRVGGSLDLTLSPPSRSHFFIPSPGFLPPPVGRRGISGGPTVNILSQGGHDQTNIFPNGKSSVVPVTPLALNPNCPQCHPAYLDKDKCTPCVIIK